MATKDFGGATETAKDAEPITFTLHDEVFTAVSEIQGSVLIDLVAKTQDAKNPAKAATAIPEFFEAVLLDESWERFNALIHSKDKIVRLEKLGDISGWLVEQFADRPEE